VHAKPSFGGQTAVDDQSLPLAEAGSCVAECMEESRPEPDSKLKCVEVWEFLCKRGAALGIENAAVEVGRAPP
jgi:hypothetical protein